MCLQRAHNNGIKGLSPFEQESTSRTQHQTHKKIGNKEIILFQ